MRKVIKGLAILPLRVLESIALGYCFDIEKLKKGSGYFLISVQILVFIHYITPL